MDDKKIDELINKALQEDLALPEGLSERLERQIDFLAQEEISPRVSRRRSFYWITGIAAAILWRPLFHHLHGDKSFPAPRIMAMIPLPI